MNAKTAIHLRFPGKPVWILAMGFALAGCGGGPQPAIYVLGEPAAPTPAVTSEVGLPVVLVKPVEVPEYLDTTDLQERRGGEMIPSRTGRWGERLSVGITGALAAALAPRLPRMAVTVPPPVERPALQVFVDVEEFEPRTEGPVIFVSRWTVMDGTARRAVMSERTSLIEPVAGTGDAERVAAMTNAIDRLAARIAAAIARIYGT